MKKFKNAKYIVLACVLIFAFTLAGCQDSKNIVATIGDEEITEAELNEELVKIYGEKTLNSLISEKILELEIAKADIKIESKDVDKEFKTMEEQYGGKEQLATVMANSNTTEKELKQEIEKKLSIEEILKDQLKVSDEEISKYYEENEEKFTKPEQVSASHVLVETEKEAKDIREKLVAGEDIAKLAKEHSLDEGTKDNGGNLGFFERGKMVGPFDEVAFKLAIDEISQPVKSDFGYHVIVVHEKNEETVTSLEENKETIKEALKQDKFQEVFNEWYSKIVADYKVDNTLEKKAK